MKPIPRDSSGRILWDRIEGFKQFWLQEALRRTNEELRRMIKDRWDLAPTPAVLDHLRRRYRTQLNPETRRRAYTVRDQQHTTEAQAVPSFVRELGPKDEGYFVHVSGDCIVSSDWHCPYQSQPLVEKMLTLAKRLRIKQLILNGDFLNEDSFSRWKYNRFNVPWPEEKASARELLKKLYGVFDRIYYILDNHDRRLIVANEGKAGGLDESDVIELLTWGAQGGKLIPSVDYHYILVNELFRITSPKEYRRVKLSLPNRLAQLYHQHIISGGDHLFGVGLDDSGRYVIANDMAMVNRKEVPYVMTQDSSYPHWNAGFYAIINNVLYPFCDHKNLTDWDYWLNKAVPPSRGVRL